MKKGHPIFYLIIAGLLVAGFLFIKEIFSSWKNFIIIGIILAVIVGLLRHKEDSERESGRRKRKK